MRILILHSFIIFLMEVERVHSQVPETSDNSRGSLNEKKAEKFVSKDEVEVFQEDSDGKKSEKYFLFPYRTGYGNRHRRRLHPKYPLSIYRDFLPPARPRKSGANLKYPICSYEDTSFIGVENSILNSLQTESAYECKFDCRATKNCKFWTYDEEARKGDNNCFLIDLGIGRTPKDVFLDRDYVSGTRRNNCKCLRRTDFIEVDTGVESDLGPDNRRRRRRRRNRPKICPRGIKESDDIDYIYDDYDEFNESLKKAQNSTSND